MGDSMNINNDDKSKHADLSEQALQSHLDKLPKEMTPERDLWQGIEHAIEHLQHEKSDKNLSNILKFSWAASVIAAVLITWITFGPQQAKVSDEYNLVASMQQSFEQQKQSLLISFSAEMVNPLPQEMLVQLTELASARETIKKALTEDPNNSDLINLLHWTQQQELDLIEQLYQPTWQSI
jgi:hypothetical protein